MRRVAVILVVAIVALSAGLALGGSPDGDVAPDRVSILTLEDKTLEGTETDFQSIYNTGLTATTWFGKLVLARGRMVINLSATVEGGPVDFRVTKSRRVLFPGAVHIDPQRNSTSFSYTFIARGSKDGSCHYIDPEWRAAGGSAVTLTNLVMTITYNRDVTRDGKPIACA